jgi:hypothetical protein
MRLTQRHGLFAGIAALSSGTVVLQIVLTRLYSALFGHHLAFLAISLSLFGVGLGGVLLYVFPGLLRPPSLLARLAYFSGLSGVASIAALLMILRTTPMETLDGAAALRLTVLYLVSSLPFVFAGLAVAAAIQHAARDMARLYLVDLVGAATGGVLAIAALRVGAPRAVLLVAIFEALAAALFYGAARLPAAPDATTATERRPSGALVGAFVFGALALLAADLHSPWLKLPKLRWVTDGQIEFQKWNEMALITVDKPEEGGIAWMRMDGSAATAILPPDTTPDLHPDEMAYVLHKEQGPTLVIGSGGGRDIRSALKHGQKDIYAAEINPIIVNDVMKGKYLAYSGGLYEKPEVHVTVADGRSFIRRSPIPFRTIVISLVDTWAASSVGALALTENSLYTVEAFRDYVQHLTPDGTLVVNRWDAELDRLLGVAVAGLRAAGQTDPKSHLYACGSTRSTALLVKRDPLTPEELEALRSSCKGNRFNEAFAPDQPHNELRRHISTDLDPSAAIGSAPTDLSASTDDRPFFFYTIPTRLLPKTLSDLKGMEKNHQGLLTLVALLGISTVLAILFLLGPLFARRAELGKDTTGRARPLLFFFCLGAAFVFVEIALMQHFVMFLGHPVYALSTVLVALLLWAGIGSVLTAKVLPGDATKGARKRALILVAALVVYALVLGTVLDRAVSLPFAARLFVTLVLLSPLGLLMGSQAPLGVKILSIRTPELIPWCWGLNGVASVLATALGTLLAMHLGFSALLLAGGLSYLIAAIAVPRAPVEVAVREPPAAAATPAAEPEPAVDA